MFWYVTLVNRAHSQTPNIELEIDWKHLSSLSNILNYIWDLGGCSMIVNMFVMGTRSKIREDSNLLKTLLF